MLGAKVRDGKIRDGEIAESMRCSDDECGRAEWHEANTVTLDRGNGVASFHFIKPL
jgi:hypothetical protein